MLILSKFREPMSNLEQGVPTAVLGTYDGSLLTERWYMLGGKALRRRVFRLAGSSYITG